eukprot:TRINITY_DN13240_c0_g1_i1.p1 TRINITY_DN13240_c0_g1~~TRINITY_DN13240_c0_g1_i1.p1  ORF type:complete len:599 (+),score=150.82 TRINITY_DN13240_c0_g1_i1:56-1852(+)
MFWRFGFHSPYAINAKLDEPGVKLEDLFEEGEFLSEAKNHNRKLIEFLMKRETIAALISYSLKGVPPGSSTPENYEEEEHLKLRKYSYMACETIACEWSFILDELSTTSCLDVLFSYPKEQTRHNFLLSNNFARVLGILITLRPLQLADYLERSQDAVLDLLEVLHCAAVAQQLPRIAYAATQQRTLTIFRFLGIVEKILTKFLESKDAEVVANTFEILKDFVLQASGGNVSTDLIAPLLTNETLKKILDASLQSESRQHLLRGIELFNTILQFGQDQLSRNSNAVYVDTILVAVSSSMDKVALILKDFQAPDVKLSSGTLSPPLGLERIRLTEFVFSLMVLNHTDIEKAFGTNAIISNILDLFFKYPSNSLFQGVVYKMILSIIEGSSSELKDQLFIGAQLIPRIITNYEPTDPSAPEAHNNHGHRGFLTLICVHIQTFSSNCSSYLNAEWDAFVDGPLAKRCEKERPPNYDDNQAQQSYGAEPELNPALRINNDDEDDDDEDESYMSNLRFSNVEDAGNINSTSEEPNDLIQRELDMLEYGAADAPESQDDDTPTAPQESNMEIESDASVEEEEPNAKEAGSDQQSTEKSESLSES